MPRCNTASYNRLQRVFPCKCNLYHPRHKTAHRALQRLFLRLHPLNCPQYQTDKSGHNTTRATLEGAHAPGRAPTIPDTTATPGRCTGQHRPPIIIRYIMGCSGAPLLWIYARRCSISHTMPAAAGQRLHLHRVSPAGSRCFPRPAACSLAPGQRSGRAFWHPPPGGAVQRKGARRAARNHWRLPPHLFSGFRPIANKGEQ